MEDIKKRVTSYWDNRAESFKTHKQEELESYQADQWLKEIEQHITLQPGMRVLDIGTGAGFLATLCARQGCDVTGIDISEEMVAKAQEIAAQYDVNATFQVMDAEQLAFDDETFDLVIARNVTWVLPNTTRAYTSWLRVLKPGGMLLNVDADYGHDSFLDYSKLPEKHAHDDLQQDMLQESEALKQSMPISQYYRPEYDERILNSYNGLTVTVDTALHERIYKEMDQFYNPTPIFLIKVEKHIE